MNQLFSSSICGGIKVQNRIFRSATHEGFADADGAPAPELTECYLKLAHGGAGLIITGEAAVSRNGISAGYRPLLIDNDALIPKYKKLTDAVHNAKTPLVLQLQHCGRQTTRAAAQTQPVAPSAVRDKFYGDETPRALLENEIELIIHNYISAVFRAKKAGFDGVQILAAHGYLLSQFLSSYTNRRKDQWGGSLENRYRILDRIICGVREKDKKFPLFIKLNGYDARPHGMRIPEATAIAAMLEESGANAIEVSCGMFEDGLISIRGDEVPMEAACVYLPQYAKLSGFKKQLYKTCARFIIKRYYPLEDYNVPAAEAIKSRITIPVIVVGGIKSLSSIESVLEKKQADYVSMSRPFIIEPDIVNKFKNGTSKVTRCIACNFCSIGLMAGSVKCFYGKVR